MHGIASGCGPISTFSAISFLRTANFSQSLPAAPGCCTTATPLDRRTSFSQSLPAAPGCCTGYHSVGGYGHHSQSLPAAPGCCTASLPGGSIGGPSQSLPAAPGCCTGYHSVGGYGHHSQSLPAAPGCCTWPIGPAGARSLCPLRRVVVRLSPMPVSSQSLPAAPGCCTTAYADSGASVGSLAVFARCAGLLYAWLSLKQKKPSCGSLWARASAPASVRLPRQSVDPAPDLTPIGSSTSSQLPFAASNASRPAQLFPSGARRGSAGLGGPQLFPIGARRGSRLAARGSPRLAAGGSRLAARGWRAHPPASVCRVSL